jgi:hypothetical protein
MNQDNELIPIVEDDQGEGFKDPIEHEEALIAWGKTNAEIAAGANKKASYKETQMTPEEKLQIDRQLAEWPMGYHLVCSPDCDKHPLPYVEDKNGKRFSFNPTTNPAQALQVAESMIEKGFEFDLYAREPKSWVAGFGFDTWSNAPTPELATCLAALEAGKEKR